MNHNSLRDMFGQTVFERQVTPDWNAPQGVETVHTVCAGKFESNDRGNSIFVKSLETFVLSAISKLNISSIIMFIL